MRDGERQVAATLDGIRKDHVARYQWAAGLIAPGSKVIDAGCGVGYGSKVLAATGCKVHAFDNDYDALGYAAEHYVSENILYEHADFRLGLKFKPADAAVCFEVIEHLEDPRPLLTELGRSVQVLLASVPNEDVFPHGGRILYHHRHYTWDQFTALLNECGWTVAGTFGQEGPESPVHERWLPKRDRTLIARCVRPKTAEELNRPKHVCILGLGPSVHAYLDLAKGLGGRHKYADEVWGINALGGVLQCDRIFHMDDVRIQEIRAAARPESNIAAMLEWLKTTTTPVITSRVHPEYPALQEFPLQEVINELQFDYFNSTAAYAVAYAIWLGVERISLYGCDYTYPDAHDAEKGRGCLEFWLGMAAARGIKIVLPNSTALMDAMYDRQDRLYGYDTRMVGFTRDADGRIGVEFTEIEQLPTADEIEARYDHSKHPNGMIEETE